MENQAVNQNQSDSLKNIMSGTIQKNSRGEEIKPEICTKHGEYESRRLLGLLHGKERWSVCPKCREEDRIKLDQENQEAMRREMVSQLLDSCGVPQRFKGKTLEEIQSKSAKQKSVIKAVVAYLQVVLTKTSACLILCGKPGTGKTHIGCAMVMAVCRQGRRAEIVSAASMLRRIKATWGRDAQESEERVLGQLGSLPFLVIDEVGVQFGSDTERMLFHEVIDTRYGAMLPTVLISNLTVDELTAFIGERAIDRFKEDGGAVLAFDWESHRGKA